MNCHGNDYSIFQDLIEIIGGENDRISEDEENEVEDEEQDSKWSDIDSVYSTNSSIFIGGEQRLVFKETVFSRISSVL